MPKKKLTAKEKWMEKNKPAKDTYLNDLSKANKTAFDKYAEDRMKKPGFARAFKKASAEIKASKPKKSMEPPPKPIPGIKRGTCAFPVKPKKACGKKTSLRGQWCDAHREEVRKAQLAYNTAQWFKRNKTGKTAHNLWFGDRPTMAAFRDEKTLAAAKAKAKEMHPEWTDKHIASLVEKERNHILQDGPRQNPSLKLSELKALGGKVKLSKFLKEPVKKPEKKAPPKEKKSASTKAKKAVIKKVEPARRDPVVKAGMPVVEAPTPAPKVESHKAPSGMTVPGLNLGSVPA